jgi:transmembrane sensor
MNRNIDYKILINFSKGIYSYKDYLKVKNWFNRIEENSEIKEQLYAHWLKLADSELDKDYSLQHIFEKIEYNILLEEKKEAEKINLWSYYSKAASILLIPVLGISLWYYILSNTNSFNSSKQSIVQTWVEINAPDGARVEFLLPDSSRGWLNAGSKLKYPAVFNDVRKVELTGEGWFDVKHLDKSEFIVSVPDMDIKVLGTQFNVSAYSDDIFTSVELEGGKVEVKGKVGIFNYSLLPNEQMIFNRDKLSLKKAKVDASRYSSWKDGYLIIENEPLGQIVGRLERWYNVEIDIQDEVLKKYRFKATFKDEPLQEVLRLMARTTPMMYKIEKREMDSNGVLKQKKVTIKLKQ